MPKPTHILIIRLSAMGDVAMTVPVLRVVAQTYPNIALTILTKPYFIPLFKDIPNLNVLEADVYGAHKGIGLLNLAREAKAIGIDAVADLHNVIRSRVISQYLKISGIKVGTIDKGRAEKKALTRKENKKFRQLKSTHQRYADVFDELGLPIDLSIHCYPHPKKLSAGLKNLIGDTSIKKIGIAPFAAFKSKEYPLDLLKELFQNLEDRNNYKVFLFGGGAKEIEIMNGLEKEYQTVSCAAISLSFEEELSLISKLDLMVSMDSSNGHLAALYQVTVITLWGVTHPFAGFAPFGQPHENSLLSDRTKFPLIPTSIYGNKYPDNYVEVMRTITPEAVVHKILEIL